MLDALFIVYVKVYLVCSEDGGISEVNSCLKWSILEKLDGNCMLFVCRYCKAPVQPGI